MHYNSEKWLHWNLWIHDGMDEGMGIVTDCKVKGDTITFTTARGEFTFNLTDETGRNGHGIFKGEGTRVATLLPPATV